MIMQLFELTMLRLRKPTQQYLPGRGKRARVKRGRRGVYIQEYVVGYCSPCSGALEELIHPFSVHHIDPDLLALAENHARDARHRRAFGPARGMQGTVGWGCCQEKRWKTPAEAEHMQRGEWPYRTVRGKRTSGALALGEVGEPAGAGRRTRDSPPMRPRCTD